jgi:hypothetical protein
MKRHGSLAIEKKVFYYCRIASGQEQVSKFLGADGFVSIFFLRFVGAKKQLKAGKGWLEKVR